MSRAQGCVNLLLLVVLEDFGPCITTGRRNAKASMLHLKANQMNVNLESKRGIRMSGLGSRGTGMCFRVQRFDIKLQGF